MATILNAKTSGVGGVDFQGDSSGILQLQTGGTAALTINASQNIGIGTSSPGSILDIKSATSQVKNTSTTGTNTVQYWASNTGGNFYIGLDSSTGSSFGSAYAATLWHSGAYPMLFATNNTERMRIDSSGNVGIGATTPTAKLHVSGSSSGNSNIRLTNTFTNGRSWELNPYAAGVSDVPFTIRDVTAGADRLTIDSSGNFQFNSGYGSVATAYGCRAWVNFNGTGTVAIRASGNVTSITDNGTGDYTVNFTTAMPDANYAATSNASSGNGLNGDTPTGPETLSSNNVKIGVYSDTGNTRTDREVVCVSIIR